MSKSLGHFWGFESSLTGRGDRFGLLQVNVSMRIPTTNLPGISPTTPIAPSQSSSVVTITLRPDGFTVSLPHAPQHQGPIQTGVFGPRPTVANDNAQSTPATVELPLAAAAAMGELQVGHDLFAALGQMLRATPANTNTQGPQTQPSPATPQTHTPQAHSHQPTPSHIPANTNAHASQQQTVHTPTTSAQPTPSTTAQTPAHQAPYGSVTVRPERSLEQSFALLLRPKNEEIKSSGRNLVTEFHQELSQKAPAEIVRALKEQGFQPPNQKVVSEAIQKLVTQLRADAVSPKDISPNKQVAEILLRVAREIIGPKAELAAKGKDSFGSNDRLALYRQTFGPTQRSVPLSTGPRVWGQQLPTAQNYPQAFQQPAAQQGHQIPTTPMQNGMNGGLPQAAQQMFGSFGNAGMTQAQQAQAQSNPLNPQFAFATQAQNSQTHGSQPYLSPNQSPYTYNEKDPEEFKSEEAHDDERGQGRQQGDQGQNQQGQQQHNGYNIVTLMGPDGRLNTLDVNGGISVVKSFFRSATIKKLHILDEMYDNQQMLNPQAGAVNTYLFRAATTQEIYNQMATLSNGQVIQIMMTDIRNLPTSTTQLSTSKPTNDNVQPALVHAA